MFAEFKNTLKKMRGTIIGWSIGLLLYDMMMSSFYSSIGQMGDQMLQMLESYPEEMIAFFPSIEKFTSPIGYIDTYFSSLMSLIIGIFAVSACAKLIVGDEEKGTLDLVISHPISRTNLFWGRVLAFVTAAVIILLAAWLGWLIPAGSAGFELTALDFLLPMLPLFSVLMLFGSLALLLSMLMPAARLASSLGAALLVANYLLIGMSGLNEDLKPIFEVTPLYFYQGAWILEDPEWWWLAGMVGISLVIFAISLLLFQRRDIRVGGEAGWQLSLPLLKRSAK
jgi:ABC-2 type transport system permease protein